MTFLWSIKSLIKWRVASWSLIFLQALHAETSFGSRECASTPPLSSLSILVFPTAREELRAFATTCAGAQPHLAKRSVADIWGERHFAPRKWPCSFGMRSLCRNLGLGVSECSRELCPGLHQPQTALSGRGRILGWCRITCILSTSFRGASVFLSVTETRC